MTRDEEIDLHILPSTGKEAGEYEVMMTTTTMGLGSFFFLDISPLFFLEGSPGTGLHVGNIRAIDFLFFLLLEFGVGDFHRQGLRGGR